MSSAESPAPVLAESGRVFLRPDSPAGMSRGQLSSGNGSLSRRSRVQRRNSRRDDDNSSSSDLPSTSDDISSGQLFVKIPPADARSASSPKILDGLEACPPPRPPRSPRRLQSASISGNKETSCNLPRTPRQRTRSTDPTARRPVINEAPGRETRSENDYQERRRGVRGVSLPRQAFRNNSSDSSEQPSPLTPNGLNDILPKPIFAQNRRYHHQPRDSGLTHGSTASSSLYPKSTSTEGSYASPASLLAQDIDNAHIVTIDAADESRFHELHEMDADDVSYRLRLLMKNNYYLPPAHAKPFVEVASPETPKKSPVKPCSPTFFELFKVTKKKNATPLDYKALGVFSGPMLRTTSDSSTLSGLLHPQQSSNPMQPARGAFSPSESRQETKGRVVVVRERMDDLEIIAKQVEQELKLRETERRRIASETSQSGGNLDDFVDPTDSVDLPPAPSKEFFGSQAALLRGMGIDSSLGAALLADQLPPSSPAIWSIDSEEAAWRRELLHAAVDHSLNNSSVASPARSGTDSSRFNTELSSPGATSTSPSIRARSVASPGSSPQQLPPVPEKDGGQPLHPNLPGSCQKPIIGQQILNKIIDENESSIQADPFPNSGKSSSAEAELDFKTEEQLDCSQVLIVTTVPVRATSPAVPTMPLPPPRRVNSTPNLSIRSRSDKSLDKEDQAYGSPLEADAGHLRAEEGATVRLSDVYESHVGLSSPFEELTPPGSLPNSAALSAVKPGRLFSVSASMSTTSGSHYSDDDEDVSTFHTPREHTLASTFAASHPSLASRESCESSQLSCRTSIFRDAFDRTPYTNSVSNRSVPDTLGENSRSPSRASDHSSLRYGIVSPPPRVSSRRATSPSSLFFNGAEDGARSLEQGESGMAGSLLVPRLSIQSSRTSGDHLGHYPTSPISFFDAVEMQSRQEEEDESEESDNADDQGEIRDDVSVMSSGVIGYHSDSAGMTVLDPRTGSTHSIVHNPRQPLGASLQQRNASLPQLGSNSSSGEHSSSGAYDTLDRRRAITNVPKSSSRNTFWSKRHGKKHKLFPNPPRSSESTADQLRHEAAMEAFASAKRPRSAGSKTGGSNNHSEQELQDPSASRLDGMLVEHIEREKEVLKRITATLSKQSI